MEICNDSFGILLSLLFVVIMAKLGVVTPGPKG